MTESFITLDTAWWVETGRILWRGKLLEMYNSRFPLYNNNSSILPNLLQLLVLSPVSLAMPSDKYAEPIKVSNFYYFCIFTPKASCVMLLHIDLIFCKTRRLFFVFDIGSKNICLRKP